MENRRCTWKPQNGDKHDCTNFTIYYIVPLDDSIKMA